MRKTSLLVVPLSTALLLGMGGLAPAEAASTKAVTRTQLKSAKVPKLCGHPAGRLSQGKLPGIKKGKGFVRLASTHKKTRKTSLGKLAKNGKRGAAVFVQCSGGGNDWDTYVLFYRAGKKAPAYRAKRRLDSITGWGREAPRTLKIKNRKVYATWGSGRKGDALCCGTVSYSATFKLKGRKATLLSKVGRTEKTIALKFIAAVNRRDAKAARRYASKAVVSRAFAETYGAGWMKVTSCGLAGGTRYCSSVFTSGVWKGQSALSMDLSYRSWGSWRVTRALRAP